MNRHHQQLGETHPSVINENLPERIQDESNPVVETVRGIPEPGTLYGNFLREWLLSSLIVGGWLLSSRATPDVILYAVAWIGLAAATGIARFVGNITQRECGDLRFMWYSIHNKFPIWVNWIFGVVCAAVLFKPFFAVTVYAATGLAFFRGYREPGRQNWKMLVPDMLVRIAAGLVLLRR